VEALEPSVVGLHESDDRSAGAVKPITELAEFEPVVAVKVALWSDNMVPALAINTAVVDPALTVTEGGVVREALVFDKVTRVPPAGACLVRLTVQLVDALGPRLRGLQESDDTSAGAGGAERLNEVVRTTELRVAVMVAVWSVVKLLPAAAVNPP
jgi:hypothetical protein